MNQQPLFTDKQWAATMPVVATALTEAEALRIAQRLYGPSGYTLDRDAHEFSRRRPAGIKRYYVGTGSTLFGNGDTWEAALDAAAQMAVKP